MQTGPSRRLVGEREAAPPSIYDPLGDEAGQLVLRSSALSAADKLAWGLLRQRTESGRKKARVHPRDLAEHQGVTSDAGRQRLKNLRDKGLIQALVDARTGCWDVVLLDPRDVLDDGGVRFIPGDPQLLFPFERDQLDPALETRRPGTSESQAMAIAGDAPSWSAKQAGADAPSGHPPPDFTSPRILGAEDPSEEPPEDPPEVPPEVPRSRPPLRDFGTLDASASKSTLTSETLDTSEKSHHSLALAGQVPRRGSSGGSSPPRREPVDELAAEIERRRQQVGAVQPRQPDELALRTAAAIGAAAAWRVPSPDEQARWREQWIDTIRRRVRCPNLKVVVMVKVAAAIVAGDLKASEVEEIFGELDARDREHALRGPRSAYFVGAAKTLFARHSLEWTGYASRSAPKPK